MRTTLIAAGVVAAICSNSQAAEYKPMPWYTDNGLAITPELKLRSGYDDNLIFDDDEQIETFFTIVNPILSIRSGERRRFSELRYDGRYGSYSSSHMDDYRDHHGQLRSYYELSARQRVTADYRFERGHEARGEGLSEGLGTLISAPVTTENQYANLGYGLGALTSRHKLQLNILGSQKEYLDYRQFTANRDRNDLALSANFSRKHSARLSWLADIKHSWIDYPHEQPSSLSSDNQTSRFLLGGKWEIANLLDAKASGGVESKRFEDDRRENFNGPAWDVALDWHPEPQHRLLVATGSEAKDPDTTGDYVQETSASIQWYFLPLKRLAFNTGVSYVQQDFTGIDRADELRRYNLGTTYDFRRWLSFNLSWVLENQSSNITRYGYDKQQVWLQMAITR